MTKLNAAKVLFGILSTHKWEWSDPEAVAIRIAIKNLSRVAKWDDVLNGNVIRQTEVPVENR